MSVIFSVLLARWNWLLSGGTPVNPPGYGSGYSIYAWTKKTEALDGDPRK